MELVGDASHLFGRVCLSDHRTSRPMFRVLLRNRTAEVGKMVADGAPASPRRFNTALTEGGGLSVSAAWRMRDTSGLLRRRLSWAVRRCAGGGSATGAALTTPPAAIAAGEPWRKSSNEVSRP